VIGVAVVFGGGDYDCGMNGTVEVLRKRRSVRAYTDQPVAREVIEEILDCARLAPTAMNAQPWDFVVVTGREELARIPPLLGHAEFVAQAAFAVLVLSRPAQYAVEDCCAATENLLIAAAAHGLGACWVAGSQQVYGPAVVKAFGAPEDRGLVAIVSVGWPGEAPVVEKRELCDVVHWERF
jgi:nitroreductase